MIVEELVTLLGVELSPDAKEKLQAFDKGLDAVVSRVKQASVVLTAAAGGMALYFSKAVDGAADLQTLSDTTGVSTTKLQEWAYAANAMGVSASAVQSDLAKMEKQARWTGRTLESYASQFKGMDAATANIWGDAYGLSPETVLLLRQGADGIAKLKAEAHDVGAIIPPETVKRASDFKAQITQITTMIRGMATTIALAALPQAERLADTFKGWITENREWIRLNMGRFIEGMGTAFERVWKAGKRLLDWVKDALGPVGDFFQKINKGTDWSKLLTGALILLLASFAPLITGVALISAGFALASAIVEDFFGFLEGKDSGVGRIIDAVDKFFTDLGAEFPALRDMLHDIAKYVSTVFKTAFDGVVSAVKSVWDNLDKVWDSIKSGIKWVANLANEFAKLLGYGDEAERKETQEKALENYGNMYGGPSLSPESYGCSGKETKNTERESEGEKKTFRKSESRKPDASLLHGSAAEGKTAFVSNENERDAPPSSAQGFAGELKTFAEQLSVYSRQRTGMQTSSEGQSVIRMPQKNGPTITDNRSFTVYQTITPSDPQQAADMAAKSFKNIAQIVTPGMNAPVVY